MSSSTNINDLPIKDNVQITVDDTQSEPHPQHQQQNVSLDPNTINQIVNELHQATLSGSTKLVSRDIPMDTLPMQQDVEISPNFVPELQNKNNTDYIPGDEDLETIIKKQNINVVKQNNIENMYNELQGPVLLGLLYFLFQLPIFKKYLYQVFPKLFMNDGNLSINGYIFYSVLFSSIYYFLNRLVGIFDTF